MDQERCQGKEEDKVLVTVDLREIGVLIFWVQGAGGGILPDGTESIVVSNGAYLNVM